MRATPSDDALEAQVLAYLAEHPHAMDSLAGIAEWWVHRQRIRVEVDALSRAVRRLVERGALQEVAVADGPLYRLVRGGTDRERH